MIDYIKVADLPEEWRAAVLSFCEHHFFFASPNRALHQCDVASGAFLNHLWLIHPHLLLRQTDIVWLREPPIALVELRPQGWAHDDPRDWRHCVVQADGLFFDWTARQFDVHAPFPAVAREPFGWGGTMSSQTMLDIEIASLDNLLLLREEEE